MNNSTQNDPPGRFRIADLEIDIDQRTIKRDGIELDLPELSFGLLAALVRHSPGQVTKDELIRDVWGEVIVSDETLAQRVRLVRQALGDDSQKPRYIASVRGRGYRLVCTAEPITVDPAKRSARRRWFAVASVAVIALIGLWLANEERTDDPPPVMTPSLAVLPFADMSPDQAHQYFADGMQEELLTRLTQIDDMHVVSRTTVEKYRTTDLTLTEVAGELNADAIIEGSIRIAANGVRVTVQLIDGTTDRHIWAQSFDRELTVANIFSIQEEVAEQIAGALQRNRSGDETRATDKLPTDNLAAYTDYLLGRYHTFRPTPDNLKLAVTHLERATSLDSDFAEAYVALGWAYAFLGTTYGSHTPAEAFPKAREAALRALALDSEAHEARALYADILTWYDWDFVAAEKEHKRASPDTEDGSISYALFLSTQQKHDEAITQIQKRVAAHPADSWVRVNAAWRYMNAGDIDQAILAALSAGDHPDARTVLGLAYLANDQAVAAIRVFEEDLRTRGRKPTQLANLALAYFNADKSERGQQLLSELSELAEDVYFSPMLLATIHFAAGNTDFGFEHLNKAVRERSREAIFIQVDRRLDGIRDDPRYAVLLERIGFNVTGAP